MPPGAIPSRFPLSWQWRVVLLRPGDATEAVAQGVEQAEQVQALADGEAVHRGAVIAADVGVHGGPEVFACQGEAQTAIGGGNVLATLCNFTIASEHAQFGQVARRSVRSIPASAPPISPALLARSGRARRPGGTGGNSRCCTSPASSSARSAIR